MIRSKQTLIALLVAPILLAACASSRTMTSASSGSRYLVTSEELAQVGDLSAYDALVRLRPTFLRSRDPQTPTHQPTPVAVFVDGGKVEGVDALRTIQARSVKEMRFFEPPEANTRFGTGHNGGAILVTMQK
jgi:hypothetical protein